MSVRVAAGELLGTVGYEAVQPADLDALQAAVDRAAQNDLGYAVDKAKRFIKNRLLLSVAMGARNELKNDPEAFEQKLGRALTFGDKIAENDPHVGYFGSMLERVQERHKPTYDRFVPTGIARLDGIMLGGLRAGKMGVIIAPSRGGKSTLMTDIGAGAVEQGRKVLHISHEIMRRDLAERYDVRFTGVPRMWLKQEEVRVAKQLLELAKRGGDLVIKFWAPGTANAANIRALLLQLRESGWWPDLLLCDYVTKWRDAEPAKDERIAISRRFQSFFTLCREFDLPGWTGAQGNRGSFQKKRVDLDDVGECWDIIATTDVALLLGADPDMESRNCTNINKGKDRDFGNEIAEDFSFNRELAKFE